MANLKSTTIDGDLLFSGSSRLANFSANVTSFLVPGGLDIAALAADVILSRSGTTGSVQALALAANKFAARGSTGALAAKTITDFGLSLVDDVDAAAARATLNLVIGTDVQAQSANLNTFAGIAPSADVQTLLGASSFAAFRTSLGLVVGTDVQAHSSALDTLAAKSLSGTGNIALKTYVDDAVASAVTGLQEIKGNIDCSGNPNYPAASNGDTYRVSVAGRIGGAGGKRVSVGDMVIAFADNAGGDEAAVGASWNIGEGNLEGLTSFGVSIITAADASAARTLLSLVPGADVQAYSANLNTFAGIAPSADVQTLLGASSFAAFRTSLGLVIGTDVQAQSANLNTFAGITPGAGVATALARPLLASTVSSATDITLSVSSAETQEVTGTSAQNILLPAVSTLVAIGWKVFAVNRSTGVCNIKTSGGTSVITLAPKQCVTLICDNISTNTAASWRIVGLNPMPFAAAKDSGSSQTLTGASVNAYVPVEFPTSIAGDLLTASNTTWTAKVDGVVELTFSCVLSSLLDPAYDPENLFVYAGYKINSGSEVDVIYVAPPVWTNMSGTNLSYPILVSVPISVAAGDTLKAVVQLAVTDGADFDLSSRYFRVKYINPTP